MSGSDGRKINAAPLVTIVAPTNGTVLATNEAVINATAMDLDGVYAEVIESGRIVQAWTTSGEWSCSST